MKMYGLLPHDKHAFATKIGEIVAILHYYFKLSFNEIEDIFLRSKIIQSMLDGNSALIDSFSFHLVNLIANEQNLKNRVDDFESSDLFLMSKIKGTPADWCGYITGLYFIYSSSSLLQSFQKCHLQTLYDKYPVYHLVNEKRALVEIFGMTLEEVI